MSHEAIASFLEKIHGTLRPAAAIVIMGPNFRYCRKEHFDVADHTVLTHMAVAEHLHVAGSEPTEVVPRFLPYCFNGRLPPLPVLTRRYHRMPLARRVLGKQFLLIGQRA